MNLNEIHHQISGSLLLLQEQAYSDDSNLRLAVGAGVMASTSSIIGKTIGFIEGDWFQCNCVKFLLFFLMIASNAAVWTFFVKALNSAKTSLTTTVISAATNYIFSALLGYFLFDETVSTFWYLGFSLVVCGLFLICANEDLYNSDKNA